MILLVALHELHPFIPSELDRIPQKRGVFVLFQVENPIYADSAEDLRKGVSGAKAQFPGATHFSVEEVGNSHALRRRLAELNSEMKQVRTRTFTGMAR